MALDIQRMLGQLSPARPIDLGGSSGAREQLRLAREEFEFRKRNAQEEKELRRLEEQGRMAREQMEQERLRAEKLAEREAQQQAALLAQQQTALGKAGELGGTGKAQQLAAMSPLMDQLGYDQNYLGSVGGLPAYDFVNRAQEQARAEQEFEQGPRAIESWDGGESAVQSLNRLQGLGLGYPTNERGTLEDPGGADRPAVTGSVDEALALEPQAGGVDEATGEALTPGDNDYVAGQDNDPDSPPPPIADVTIEGRAMIPASLEPGDPFARALAASRFAEATKQPARGPGEEDYMGAVPRNRIDMAAMAAETMARLNPALQARVASLPPELQDAAKANAAAIGGLGLEATDAIKEMDSAMEDPVSIYNSQQNLEAEQAKRTTPSMMDVSTYRERGDKIAKEFANARGVTDILKAVNSAAVAENVLDNDDPNDDTMIAGALMDAQNIKGTPSNTDLAYAMGMSKASTITQIVAKIQELLVGGMSDAQKAAIKNYLRAVQESQRAAVNDYLNNAYNRLDSGELNEHEARGYKGAIEQSIPAWMYNDYWDAREKAGRAGGQRTTGPGQNAPAAAGELQRQAESAGLNGQVLGQLMGGESGGKTDAASDKSSAKGVFQLIDSTAQAMGFKNAAEYSAQPLDKQIEVGLKLFKNKGLNAESPAEDYALVLAAPAFVGKWKSRDDVVYKKDSDEWKGNAPWRPADGGDITVGSITDYYLKAGRQRAADADKAEAAPAKGAERKADAGNPYANLPEPKTPEEKRMLELLRKKGG
jgi:hypothetical protein